MNDTTKFVDITDEIKEAAAADPRIDEGVAQMWESIRRHKSGLAALRAMHGLTQKEFGDLVGVSQGAISQVEAKNDIMVSTLTRHLDVLGATAIVRMHDGTEIDFALLLEQVDGESP